MSRLKKRKILPTAHQADARFGTHPLAAQWRAKRLEGYDTIIEIGAGAGFQTTDFAKTAKRVIAIEIDEERAKRGTFPKNVDLIIGDALEKSVIDKVKKLCQGTVALFADTERPATATERTLDQIQPSPAKLINAYSTITTAIAIELPPFLSEIPFECEREYLSIDRKLNRLTIYLGDLQKSEVSVVALPTLDRIEHSGPILDHKLLIGRPKYVLVPDDALVRSGIVNAALAVPVNNIGIAKKPIYLSETPLPLFASYKIVAIGRQPIFEILIRYASVVLHGSMSEEEQRSLLRELQPRCKGKGKAHLFLMERWYLATSMTR